MGWICSAQFEFCSGIITRDWADGGQALKFSWYIFGNTEMYHLCVQLISSSTREEIPLGPVEPLDEGRGRTREALPVREVVGVLAVRYQRGIVLKSCSTDFNGIRFHENSFPQNSFAQIARKKDEGKASNPWLLILFVGCIGLQ